METKTIQTASLDELGTKINELLQDHWFVNTDFSTNTIYGYKPIPERKQPAAPIAVRDSKHLEKTAKASTQSVKIEENATHLVELEQNERRELQKEKEEAEGELRQATEEQNTAGIEAATAKKTSAENRLATNEIKLAKASGYLEKAVENGKAIRKENIKASLEAQRSVDLPTDEPQRSISEPSPTTSSRSV
jgi:hypothetical protein